MWKEHPDIKPIQGLPRYRAYWDMFRDAFIIMDHWRINKDWGPGEEPPEDAILPIPREAASVLLDAIAKTKLIDHVLAGKTYTKDAMNRHLDVIEKLIEKI